MQLIELLNAASRGWDRATAGLDEPLDNHFVLENGEIKSNPLCRRSARIEERCGDWLCHVAVEEIIETYEPQRSDDKQVHEAARVVERLALNLLGISYEIRALDVATTVSDDRAEATRG